MLKEQIQLDSRVGSVAERRIFLYRSNEGYFPRNRASDQGWVMRRRPKSLPTGAARVFGIPGNKPMHLMRTSQKDHGVTASSVITPVQRVAVVPLVTAMPM